MDPTQMNPIQQLYSMIIAMREAFGQLQYAIKTISVKLDSISMTAEMFKNILVEQKLITDDEFNERYKVEVVEKLQTLIDENEKKAKEIMETQNKEASLACETKCDGKCASCNNSKEVVEKTTEEIVEDAVQAMDDEEEDGSDGSFRGVVQFPRKND